MRRYIVLLFLLVCCLQFAVAKGYYYRNISKEKPRFFNLNWKFTELPMAILYYYDGEEELASYVGNLAKEYQQEMAEKSSCTIEGSVPIFLYSVRTTFKQLQIISDAVPEGLMGLTMIEPNKRTAFVHDGSMRNTRHVTRHELFHSFSQGIYNKVQEKHKHLQVRFPVWFEEGLAEAFSKKWDSWDDIAMRDLVLQGKVSLEDFSYPKSHNFARYLMDKYGENKIIELIKLEKSFYEKFKTIYGKSIKELEQEWQYYIRKKYYKLINNDDAIDIAKEVDEGFSPVFASSSSIYYIYNYYGINQIIKEDYDSDKKKWGNRKILYKDMQLNMEQIKFIDYEDDKLVFVAYSKGKDCLYLTRGKELRKVEFKDIVTMYNLDLHKDKIAFSGQTIDGMRDIYVYDLAKDKLERLTADFYCDITPSFKSDTEILFASDRYGNYDLYLIDLNNLETKRITDSESEELHPGIQGNYLFYISDMGGTFNLCRKDLENGKIYSTNVTYGIMDYSIFNSSQVALVYYQNASNYIYTTIIDSMNFKEVDVSYEQKKEINNESIKLVSEPYSFYPIGFFSGLIIYNEFEGAASGSFIVSISDLLGECEFFLISAISKEQLFWFTFKDLHYPLGYGIDVFNLVYGVYSETGDYAFISKGITLSLERPISDFYAVGCWATTQVTEKDNGRFGLFLPFFEGPGPVSGKGQLSSFGLFARKDTTTWNNYGPVTGTIGEMSLELSNGESGDFSYITWAKFMQHFPTGDSSCYAYRLIGSFSVGERGRVYRLGGFTLMSYDLFQAFESKSLLAFSHEYRFLLMDALGFQISKVFIGFREIQTAFFMDIVGADNNFGAIGVSTRLPFAMLLLKFNYVKRTDFNDISGDLSQPGRWYFSLGYNF